MYLNYRLIDEEIYVKNVYVYCNKRGHFKNNNIVLLI